MTTGGTTNPQGPSTSSIKGLITKSNRQDPVPEPDDNVDKPEATTGSAGENENQMIGVEITPRISRR
jgi:hypothetical protein